MREITEYSAERRRVAEQREEKERNILLRMRLAEEREQK
jgi:hypothetical protein